MDPKWIRIIAVGVVVILVIAGVVIYYELQNKGKSTNGSAASCSLTSSSPLLVDQAEQTDTADPQWASSTPDWGLVQQVYQTLIMYNQSSITTYTGVLAHNWSSSADGFHWNFTLNGGVHFSNGDPFNAYVMWFSLYRLLAMEGINQYLLSENFWYPGVSYYSNATQVASSLANVTNALNTYNFAAPSSSEIAYMAADNQSFRVLAPNEIQVNLGFGYLVNSSGVPTAYAYLLAELSTPGAAAVDPMVIQANGGVTSGPNSWMATNAVGTGPFNLSAYSSIEGYSISPNKNYWATQLAAQEPWNNNLQPARTAIQVNFQDNQETTVADLKTGAVATASFAYLGPATIQEIQNQPCITVQNLSTVFSGAGGSWWVFMNQSVYPFNNWSVRAAIVHAINYSQVIQEAFGGDAYSWVGPIAPGHPFYNPDNLQPYQFNLGLARSEIANSPCANNACAGMSFNYEYLSTSNDWEDAATIIASNLAEIGITVVPVGVTLTQFYALQTIDPNTGQCTGTETGPAQDGGPFYIGQDFYSSDYISPDDWTQQDFLSYGSANICNSGFNNYGEANYNYSLDDLVLAAAGIPPNSAANNSTLAADYAEMTQMMYANYTNAWFAVPYLYSVYSPLLTGYFQTPMGSTELDTMGWNTIYAK